jgi:hypothetical protein
VYEELISYLAISRASSGVLHNYVSMESNDDIEIRLIPLDYTRTICE